MTVLKRLLLIATVLIAAMAAVWSYPTLYGDTGLILVPTADTLNDTYIEFAADYTKASTDLGDVTLYPLRLTYGASDNNELFVVAATTNASSSKGGFDILGGGFKVSFIKEDLLTGKPGLAVGARAVQFRGAIDTREIDGYAVVSKTIYKKSDVLDEEGYTFRGHLAAFFNRYTGTPGEENFWSLAGGVSYTNFNGTSVAIDYVPKLESRGILFRDSEISFVLRRPLSDEFFIEAGATEPFGQGGGGNVYAGLLYRWGIREVPSQKRPRIEGVDY